MCQNISIEVPSEVRHLIIDREQVPSQLRLKLSVATAFRVNFRLQMLVLVALLSDLRSMLFLNFVDYGEPLKLLL